MSTLGVASSIRPRCCRHRRWRRLYAKPRASQGMPAMREGTRVLSTTTAMTSLSRSPDSDRSLMLALPMTATQSSTMSSFECTYTCSVMRRPLARRPSWRSE